MVIFNCFYITNAWLILSICTSPEAFKELWRCIQLLHADVSRKCGGGLAATLFPCRFDMLIRPCLLVWEHGQLIFKSLNSSCSPCVSFVISNTSYIAEGEHLISAFIVFVCPISRKTNPYLRECDFRPVSGSPSYQCRSSEKQHR